MLQKLDQNCQQITPQLRQLSRQNLTGKENYKKTLQTRLFTNRTHTDCTERTTHKAKPSDPALVPGTTTGGPHSENKPQGKPNYHDDFLRKTMEII